MPDLEKVKGLLKEVISDCLYGPGGDPAWENLNAAKNAYLALKELDPDYVDDDVETELRGENVYDEDFLTD